MWCRLHGLSERRACTLIGMSRGSVWLDGGADGDADLRGQLRTLAVVCWRFSWKRLDCRPRAERSAMAGNAMPSNAFVRWLVDAAGRT